MDSLGAMLMGMANRGRPVMVFDWHKAVRLINERKPRHVRAGLQNDWEYTGGTIFVDGKIPEDHYTYLASTWATPQIDLDGEIEECYVMQSDLSEDKWNANTFWPESARKMLDQSHEIRNGRRTK